MNAILRFPAAAAEDFAAAEGTVATMATVIRNAVENRGTCLDDDLACAGFSPVEIREYGPIARARVAPGLILAGLVEDLTDLPEPSQSRQFAAGEPPFALPLRVVDCSGGLILEAADGENLIRVQSMSTAKRARLEFIAAACNAQARRIRAGGGCR